MVPDLPHRWVLREKSVARRQEADFTRRHPISREHWGVSEEAARERALKDRRVGAGRGRSAVWPRAPQPAFPPGVTDRLSTLPRTARKSQGCTWWNTYRK